MQRSAPRRCPPQSRGEAKSIRQALVELGHDPNKQTLCTGSRGAARQTPRPPSRARAAPSSSAPRTA
eukprot:15458391-Alexandrium_andersonii.AAC.1